MDAADRAVVRVHERGLWIGGDALVASFAVRALTLAALRGEAFPPGDAPIDGASWSELAAAARSALAARG